MLKRLGISALSFFLGLLLLTGNSWAQQTLGGITGEVSDASGALISDATVTAVDTGTGLTRSVKTSASGAYLFSSLPIGTYSLTITHDGFETQKMPSILVQADRTATINASLKIGQTSESVTVEASPLMNAVDTTNGYILDKAQIDAVPLPTGSFTGVAILAPGVNAELPGGTGSNSGLGNAPIWANGQRDTSNSFLLNGVDASNLFNGKSTSQVASARIVNNTGVGNAGAGGVEQSSASVYLAIGNALPSPAPETLQEIRVNTSMYDAQQGATSGAHIDMSTETGTNKYHGQLYAHRGTDWLNAAPFFFKQSSFIPEDEKVPQLHRYIAGGSIGGPIIKDKLFGYVAYQHVHIADQEIGISRLVVPAALTDDRSAGALANVANEEFGTDITAADISPVALFLMQYKMPNGQYLMPSPTTSAAPTASDPYNASIPGTSYFTADQGIANLDWNATSKDTLAAKYYYQHDPLAAPYAYSNVSGFTQKLDTGSQVFSLNNTQLVKPALSITEVLGFLREKAYGVNEQPFGPAAAGISAFGSSYFPGISIIDNLGNDSSTYNPNGVYDASANIGPGSFTQSPFTGLFQNRIMPSASAIWTLGKHTVTFGGSYSYTQLNVRDDRTGKGMIATSDFGNFLEGNLAPQNTDYTTTSFMVGNANRYYRANQAGAYIQDKFQATPTLSLTAGIRYDWNGGLTEKDGKIFNFDPSGYAFDGNEVTSNGFVVAGNNKLFPTAGVSDTTLTGRQWGIGPRLGLAWEPKELNGKVVVRSGTGIYYDRGELFTYLSPGYAAGEVTGGPFGVNQTPPFVNTVQCNPNDPQPTVASDCGGTFNLSTPWGDSAANAPSGNPADISKYLPTVSEIENGAQLFSFANYNRANKLPYSINYTLDVQWQPRSDLAIDIAYVGNVGRHQVVPVPFNQAETASPTSPINGQNYTYGYSVQSAGSAADTYCNCSPATLADGTTYLATYEGGNIDLRVPYVGYSAESETYKAAGLSAYNAVTAHVEKRLSHGIQGGLSYTYSHSLDEQSAMGLFYNGNNPLDLHDGYASSDFDRTHVINFTWSYTSPAFLGENTLAGRALNSWTLQGLTVLQSGQPYSIIDYSGAVGSIYYGVSDGITNPIVPLAPGCTPKKAYTGKSGAFGTPALDSTCFTIPLLNGGALNGAIPANDTFETNFTSGQRNIFRQSWQKRADASLAKNFKITDSIAARYTFDVFNLTNTTSFDIPGDNVAQNDGYNDFPVAGTTPAPSAAACAAGTASSTPFYNCPSGLGYVTHTIGSPRQIQMSLRVTF
ncbi:carboxypeptidase-like regulatory domain-containing protein [Silvibacterium dinghuense]|uniref:TonB-dependent receptor n=1 Tax=Silvibacterium dinghuense TaxID=1560006 RepID=A0A4Q1SHU1_9BACT|nr:TonB-dependent receptor [Silvibacterium dinghuense]RXS96937.1 TonB-dependent receptor [Silvibacterium dinghuense]GGG94843.1 hypothetical protein GCM10011586_07260 [Silvibacterium dinghuense]